MEKIKICQVCYADVVCKSPCEYCHSGHFDEPTKKNSRTDNNEQNFSFSVPENECLCMTCYELASNIQRLEFLLNQAVMELRARFLLRDTHVKEEPKIANNQDIKEAAIFISKCQSPDTLSLQDDFLSNDSIITMEIFQDESSDSEKKENEKWLEADKQFSSSKFEEEKDTETSDSSPRNKIISGRKRKPPKFFENFDATILEESSDYSADGDGVKTSRRKNRCHKCPICPVKTKSASKLETHIQIHGVKQFQCEVCGKEFLSNIGLKNHGKVHEEKEFPCSECTMVFKSVYLLRKHERLDHFGQKGFTCPYCHKSFSTQQILNNHVSCHTGQFQFCCELCGKGFSSKSVLQLHRNTHTKERPFSCHLCGKAYSNSGTLHKHKLRHQEMTKEKVQDSKEYKKMSLFGIPEAKGELENGGQIYFIRADPVRPSPLKDSIQAKGLENTTDHIYYSQSIEIS
ncbi:zinc finger protein 62 homolog [Artemia franciscana]|uniref:C2H2-type domain-containing protein n=1 Tax=Artemia franciscana TaxID=6661 RepID=A0AA88LBB9_ARTSF|nr:hypothetical protein QYM36_005416 [Artemia franciscana]KAK2719938.1 hypothetical protein QYM36_005416 [Artemia franciscana]KAK2719939.1 hypothetical protein QYM36_005416 [Artemia franciscana]